MSKENIIKEMTTQTTRYWMVDGKDILYGEILSHAELELDHVIENFEKRKVFLDESRPIPIIINIKKIFKISKEARKYSASATAGLSAIAMIVDSGLSKIIGNYAMFINRPKIPTKMFNTKKEAEKWVEGYLPKA